MLASGILDYSNSILVDGISPINWMHPLNRGLKGWWMVMPNWGRGTQFINLCQRYHGTLTGMDPITDWMADTHPGGWGSLDFDGTDDYVNVGDVNDYDFGDGSFSFSVWFKANTSSPTFPLNKRALTAVGYEFLIANAGVAGDIRPRVGTSSISVGWTGTNDGKFHHALAVVDRGADLLYFYGDGVLKGSITISGIGSQSSAQALQFGARGGASFAPFQLSSAAIWGRALSAGEAKRRYQLEAQYSIGLLNRVRHSPYTIAEAAAADSTVGRDLLLLLHSW